MMSGQASFKQRGGSMSMNVVSKYQRSRADSGSVLIEFAISAVFFALLLLGTFDLIRVYQIKGQLQSATDRVSRLSALGGVLPGLDRIESIESVVKSLSGRNSVSIAICPVAQRPCTGINVGSEKEWMYIKATTQVPLVLNAVNITLTSESLVRNEPVFKERTIESGQTYRAVGILKPRPF